MHGLPPPCSPHDILKIYLNFYIMECRFCYSKVKKDKTLLYLDNLNEDHLDKEENRLLREIVVKLEEENRNLRRELLMQNMPKVNKGSINILKDDFKKACEGRKIKLALDLEANRVRFSYKSKNKKYRRLDFKLEANPETLFGRADQLVRDIADWVQDHDWSHNSRGFSYYVRYIEIEDKFLICDKF